MSTSHKQPRKKRGQGLSLEMLEERQLLSAGMGSTFAIMPGTDRPRRARSRRSSSRSIPASSRRRGGGKIVLGIDVAADPRRAIKPQIVSIKTADGRVAGQAPPLLLHARRSSSPTSWAVR